jgi:argininosuccinate lyase
MKLWEKGVVPNPSVIKFTSGSDPENDVRLAGWDIVSSMAHTVMLYDSGLISAAEKADLLGALNSLLEKEKKGGIVIEEGVEDIHSQIEKILTQQVGLAGKKIHTGRSRNDQVLTDIRLYTRELIDDLAVRIAVLFKKLQELSEKYREVFIPGYTHMQPAMVSTFGLWFGSYSECLADDILFLSAARELNNRNPLGTAAGYGSTLPLQRRKTTALLEFGDLLYNSAYASLNRGKAEFATASALSSIAQTLSRLSMDICLYMSAEFRFVDFPDEFITGSSIMPQKRNPDVFEIIRGKAGLIQSLPGQVSNLVSGLPSGYNRELQLLKSLIFDAFYDIRGSVEILLLMLGNIIVTEGVADRPVYNTIFSTEEVNRLVKSGIPFREAYRNVAAEIGKGVFPKTAVSDYTHEGSLGNLCNDKIEEIFRRRMEVFSGRSKYELAAKMMKMI